MGGLGRPCGRRFEAPLMAAWTSCSATSMLRSNSNCSVMTEQPNELVEVIWFRPGIWPNWRSSGAVTEDAITSGLNQMTSTSSFGCSVITLQFELDLNID